VASKLLTTSRQRSELMSRVRQRGTSLELVVRDILRDAAVKFESNATGLAGTPDIVNREHKWAVFINGCFWHGHTNCWHGQLPKSNVAFWVRKISANKLRDQKKVSALRTNGYRVLTLWECEMEDKGSLSNRLARFIRQK